MIGVVDYGMGNLLSVSNALFMLGAESRICRAPGDLRDIDRVILPGVGAFEECMINLRTRGFIEALNEVALSAGKPVMGICLGMQVMARWGFEGCKFEGLGWFNADVVRLEPRDAKLRIPHVGWNNVAYRKESVLFAGLPESPDFYFVHSYHMRCDDGGDVDATFDYGGTFTAAVRRGNIFASQFHPEKSQDFGLKVIENFLSWVPCRAC